MNNNTNTNNNNNTNINNMLLSRYQKLKNAFIDLGNKYSLPEEIVKLIYYSYIKQNKKDVDEIRMFYKNMILMHTLSSLGNLERGSQRNNNTQKNDYYLNWKLLYNENQKEYNDFKEDIYKYRLPTGRNCEWGIKNSQLKRRMVNSQGELIFTDTREKILMEIKIIGSINYLLYPIEGSPFKESEYGYLEAELKHKIKYLEITPWWEIEEDYLNWIDSPFTLKDHLRVVILPSSESILYSDHIN